MHIFSGRDVGSPDEINGILFLTLRTQLPQTESPPPPQSPKLPPLHPVREYPFTELTQNSPLEPSSAQSPSSRTPRATPPPSLILTSRKDPLLAGPLWEFFFPLRLAPSPGLWKGSSPSSNSAGNTVSVPASLRSSRSRRRNESVHCGHAAGECGRRGGGAGVACCVAVAVALAALVFGSGERQAGHGVCSG